MSLFHIIFTEIVLTYVETEMRLRNSHKSFKADIYMLDVFFDIFKIPNTAFFSTTDIYKAKYFRRKNVFILIIN